MAETALEKVLDDQTLPPDVPTKRIILTPQQEAFAQAVIMTGIPSKAYRLAYPKSKDWLPTSVWVEACKLMKHPKVRLRIKQLVFQAGKRSNVTVESLIVELDQNRNGALESGQFPAANSATMAKAKITGHLREEAVRTGDIHVHFDLSDRGLL